MEELLSLIGLDGDTTGESVYNALVSKLDELGIPLDRCMSVTTDGAPAMVGTHQGLVARLRKDKQSLLAFHCIIHQTVLCGKLNVKFQALMTNSMKMINYLKSKSALRHCKLREFLHVTPAKYDDLLTHNNVRWLSKGSALARIWELRGELNSFLETCGPTGQPFLDMLRSSEDMANLAFLLDICGHLNRLNLRLQGKEKSVIELRSSVKSFEMQLDVFKQDLESEMMHFPCLKTFVNDWEYEGSASEYLAFIEKIKVEFEVRFGQFQAVDMIVQLIKSPLEAKPEGEWKQQVNIISDTLSIAAIQLELCDLKASESAVSEGFWMKATTSTKYPQLCNLAIYLLTSFASTYLCESAFSSMNHIKNELRSALTQEHVHQLLRVACSQLEPDYEVIMTNKSVFHLSH